MKLMLLLMALTLAGCLRTQPLPHDNDQHMMIADIVPLAADEQPYQRGQPMRVPEEPSRFEMRSQLPFAMKSDLESARRADEIYETEQREKLKEPLP